MTSAQAPLVKQRDNVLHSFLLTSVFVVCGALLITHHEMWRDELEAWMLARDSVNILDLFANVKYQGHPGLWYLLVMPLTRIFSTPVSMQYLHLAISTLSIYLLVRYSPFTSFQKTLLVFNYFLFYEYSVISRMYALAVLLIFIVCTFYQRRYDRPFTIAISLFLLSHTDVFGLIASIVLCAALVLDWFLEHSRRYEFKFSLQTYGGALLVILIGVITAVVQLQPPEDSHYLSGWRFSLDSREIAHVVYPALIGAYLPVPKFEVHFWGTELFASNRVVRHISFIGVMIFIYLFLRSLFNRPIAAVVFLGCSVGFLSFFYTKHPGHIRHHGFLFISLIASVWIAASYKKIRIPTFLERFPRVSDANMGRLLNVVLSVHVVAGLCAAYFDYRYVFSNAMNVAEFIRKNDLQDKLIVGHRDYQASAVAGYLQSTKFYYPIGRRFGSFVRLDEKRWLEGEEAMEPNAVLEAALSLSANGSRQVVLVLDQPLIAEFQPLIAESHSGRSIKKLAEFTGAIVSDENYSIYEIVK